MARAALAGALLVAQARGKSGNMNGKYSVASVDRQDVPFNDDYASKGHEYFDVYTPELATHYSEVFWTDMGNIQLPDSIVKRFQGKTMAITGYEMDQVMVEPVGRPGANPDKDVSVPINWVYNHHYMLWMTGQHSEMREVTVEAGSPMAAMAHGATTMWIAEDAASAALRADTSIPTSQLFSEGNGGESRKSFHGYPDGYAQLLDSPNRWHITPMQIDTRNRDCGATPADIHRCTQFTPGPEPRQARHGRGIPKGGTNNSGILECPCNSRYGGDPMFYPDSKTKIIVKNYAILGRGTCPSDQLIEAEAECFSSFKDLGIPCTRVVNRSVSDSGMPAGCSVVKESNGTAVVYFNSDRQSSAQCTEGSLLAGEAQSAVGVHVDLKLESSGIFKRSGMGEYCENNREDKLKVFPMSDATLAAAYSARDQCERYCWAEASCWGCSVDCHAADARAYGRLLRGCEWNAVSSCGRRNRWPGSIEGDVSQKNATGGKAVIRASGPADRWFGIGINAMRMADAPYTLVFSDEGVFEQKIGTCGSEAEHCPGNRLRSSVELVSNTVASGVRTVEITRPLVGMTKDHYTFDPYTEQTMQLLTAVGYTQTFAHHQAHAHAVLALTSDGSATCVCGTGSVGMLCETGGEHCQQFNKQCNPEPFGDLAAQKNPTCSSSTYVGGLSCCRHKGFLLDADQEIPSELLRYHMKFRFWFQEYKPSPPSHADLPRIYYQTEANAGEYDVPPAFARPGEKIPGYPSWPEGVPTPGTSCTGTCPDGPDCECVHTITAHWNVSSMRLIYAGGHCHAPSCISIELYRNDTGTPQLLCRQLPKYGKGNFPEDKWDEADYVMLPPCLWSDEDPALEDSVWLPKDTPLFSVKRNKNTHVGHYGEMASWQMRGVFFPAKPPNYV